MKKLFKKGECVAISHYLDERLVLFLDADSRDDALDQLVRLLEKEGRLKNTKAFHDAILEREKIVSTGIGLGVAIPHAKLRGYEDFFIAIGIQAKQGIEWNALDAAPVRLVFMIGGPDNKQTEYLKILSHLTMAIKNEERRKKLLKTYDAQEVIALFAGC
ncbi:MAG: PTS sugar transporter subunit IIA [Candidatus Melainabacteria bacterium]|nr:PTS sugar transporter subunit IIA [Candidatus Melainabacteria bacterium]